VKNVVAMKAKQRTEVNIKQFLVSGYVSLLNIVKKKIRIRNSTEANIQADSEERVKREQVGTESPLCHKFYANCFQFIVIDDQLDFYCDIQQKWAETQEDKVKRVRKRTENKL
jgi:hypothetical protein